MKTCVALYGAFLAAAVVLAEEKSWVKKSIDFKEAEPIPEPEPKTIGDKAGVKFKPQIHVTDGCPSYPAVNAAGETTQNDFIEESTIDECKGSEHKSQIYGRSTWHRQKFAIMYTWHFPPSSNFSTRYDWEHVVLWLNNPAVKTPTLEAVSIWNEGQKAYTKAVPPDAEFMKGSSVKLDMVREGETRKISLSPLTGEFQPLIMWDQMPKNARIALDTVEWYGPLMPLSDSRFSLALENAWPFAPVSTPSPPSSADDK